MGINGKALESTVVRVRNLLQINTVADFFSTTEAVYRIRRNKCFYIFLLISCLFHIFSLPLRPVKIKLTRNNDESHKEY